MTLRIAIVLILIGFSPVSFSHTYKIYNFPDSDRGVSCQQRAVEMSNRLDDREGITVSGAICEYDSLLERNRIVIAYESAKELKLVSTYTFWATYQKKGNYQSEEECLAQLASEENTFVQQTGLEVFVSLCSKEKRQSIQAWYAHIDGFGDAERVPGRSSWRSKSIYGVTFDSLFNEISTRLRGRDMDLGNLVVRPNSTSGDVTIFYYGNSENIRLDFSSTEVISLAGLSNCQSQVSNLRSQLESSDRINLATAYCSSSYSNPSRFQSTIVYEGNSWLRDVYASETFDSLASCLANEKYIGDQMKAVYGDKIVAAICGNKRFDYSRAPKYYVLGLSL